jgi:hypothetical protein
MNRYRFLCAGLLVVSLLAGLPACSSAATTPTTQPPTTTRSLTTTPAPPVTTPAAPVTTYSATTTAAPTAQVDYVADIVSPRSLYTYRYTALTRIQEGDGAGTSSTFISEWNRDDNAEHAWREDGAGKVTELYIIIGASQWTYLPGQGWVKQAPGADMKPADIGAQINAVVKNPSASKARIVKKGSEVVSNVICARYEIEYTTKMLPPNAASGAALVDGHTVGEIWVGDQLGVAPFLILRKATTDMVVNGKKTVVYNEERISGIDNQVNIKPPATP